MMVSMGYVNENLISGENVTYRAAMHWTVFLKPGLAALAILGIAVLWVYLQGPAPGWVSAGLAVVAAIPILSAAIARSTAEFAVTNKRVILKTGFIQKKTAEMFLNKVESVGVDQSMAGRLLGYGAIVIRGTGGTLEPFDRISAPLEFRRQIQEQIGRSFEPMSR